MFQRILIKLLQYLRDLADCRGVLQNKALQKIGAVIVYRGMRFEKIMLFFEKETVKQLCKARSDALLCTMESEDITLCRQLFLRREWESA